MAETTAPVSPSPAAPVAPVAPAPSAPPAIPAAQQASYKAPAAKPAAPAPTQQSDNASIQERLRAVAKEAFANAKEEAGTDFVAEPNEPAKKPDAPKAEAPKAEKPKADKKTVFDAVAAEEKKPEPVAEVKDRFSDVAEPDGATETTKKGWKALKEKANAEIASAEKRVADANAQLDTFRKATPAEQANVDKLKAELKEVQDRLAVYDVSSHPDFRSQYLEPKKRALEMADGLAKDYQVPVGELNSLLDLPRPEFSKRLSEMAATMAPFDQNKFFNSMDEARNIQQKERAALSQAGELRQQLQAKTAQQEKQSFEEVWRPFDQLVKPREVPEGADDEVRSEVQQYNEARAALRAEAERNIFGKQGPKDIATIGAKAATTDFLVKNVIPSMQREYAKAMKLVQEQTAELSAIRAAKSPGTFSGDAPKSAPDPSKMTFQDSMRLAKEAAARGETLR